MLEGRHVAVCTLLLACSSAQDPAPSTTSSPSTPGGPPTFEGDVLPIFLASCGFTGCHADPGGHPRVYLGSRDDPNAASAVRAGIVGQKSVELPAMAYVAPGDTAHSYLLHKIDGDLGSLAAQCVPNADLGTTHGCGVSMPQGQPLLDGARRDVVRAWMAGGTDD
jgi:hypothetical protein